MNDLANPESWCAVSCDDKFQSFRMNTAILYGPDIDVMGWMNNHLQRRDESLRLLGSIAAIRQ
jgi:hypothetical protein